MGRAGWDVWVLHDLPAATKNHPPLSPTSSNAIVAGARETCSTCGYSSAMGSAAVTALFFRWVLWLTHLLCSGLFFCF